MKIKHSLCLVALILPMYSMAENIGTKAQTYQIDRDGREQIKDSIRQKQKSGELDTFWKNYRDKTVNAIKNPAPLGIKSEYGQREEIREARFVVPSDYKDERNNVVVKKGTVVEPLKIQPLRNGLIFIDGRDEKQVQYAVSRSTNESLKIVLTAGSPFDLRVKYKNQIWHGDKGVPFYFDQRKMIINSLKNLYRIDINSVPAVLFQRGDKLDIQFGLKEVK